MSGFGAKRICSLEREMQRGAIEKWPAEHEIINPTRP